MVGGLIGPMALAHAATPGLIANPGMEQPQAGDPTMPANWSTDSWGTNTPTFSYLNEGHTGVHAVRTALSGYQSGDAKWLFPAAPVTAGARYAYSDWYRADVVTQVWLRYETGGGAVRFAYLMSVPASATWSQTQTLVTVPSDVARLSVFHVISANGTLDLDDVDLTAAPVCTASATSSVANGTFEQSCSPDPTRPAAWQQVSRGTPTATFSSSTNPYQGSRAASTTIATAGGEAGWATDVIAPRSSQRYTLTFVQSGSTYVYAYLAFLLTDGTATYQSLMAVPSSGGSWSNYHDSFVTPERVASARLTIATSGIGTVTVDNVALSMAANQTPPTFLSPTISVSFDDNSLSAYQNGLPVLNSLRFPGTYFVNGATLNTEGYMTSGEVRALAASGSEIASHAYHHSDLVQLDAPTVASEVTGNLAAIRRVLGPNTTVAGFATPYGSFTSAVVKTAMRYHQYHRTSDGQLNTRANLDAWQIHARLVKATTTLGDVQAWVSQAQVSKGWLVLVFHGISPTASPAQEANGEAGYTVTPAQFASEMSVVANSGIRVLTIRDALQSLAPSWTHSDD